MIRTDSHVHSSFSGDSEEKMENIINEAIKRGLTHLCFTEHHDIDFPSNGTDPGDIFLLDTDEYHRSFKNIKSRYEGKITLCFGVELGLQPHLASTLSSYVNQYPFDYVIGSEHITNRHDPYYPAFYEGRSEREAYFEYFEDIVTNLDALYATGSKVTDSLGHLDYVVRYGPNRNRDFSYFVYGEIIDEILKRLIERGIALEINAAGYKHELGNPNPSAEIIRRYKELGGDMVTIGSDAHKAENLCSDFDKIAGILTECGFKYYAFFENRSPKFVSIL